MTGPIRVTGPLLDVLEAFLQAFRDDAQLHGWAIAKATKRSGPTVYGVLDRLEDAAWITGQWEDQHPDSNKPRRRLCRLTPTGVTAARDLLVARRPQALHHRQKIGCRQSLMAPLYQGNEEDYRRRSLDASRQESQPP